MFERLKKRLNGAVESYRELAAMAPPPDLSAVPPLRPGLPGGLAAVDPAVVGAYAGLAVTSIEPIGALGPEATGFLGMKLQERLRAAGANAGNAAPGEFFPGQNARREELMRARGASEEQIEQLRAEIAARPAVHGANAWTVVFANGTRASVQVFAAGDRECVFAGMRDHFAFQHTQQGAERLHDSFSEARIQQIVGTPYESYYAGGELAACGPRHEALVKTSHLSTPHQPEVMAALAALALRVVAD